MRIFIGWDRRFPEPARVLAYSMRQHTKLRLDIRFLELRHLEQCYGFKAPGDPLASTEFTYSRFLVPYLCGYSGKALFVDNDMLCLHDVDELDCLNMRGLALRVTQHDYAPTAALKMDGKTKQTAYPRKNWSSFMLMDCHKLQCWTKEVVEEGNGARLHRFQDIPDEEIGEVDLHWNDLDTYTSASKMVHWTSGCVWNDSNVDWPHQELWLEWLGRWKKAGCP